MGSVEGPLDINRGKSEIRAQLGQLVKLFFHFRHLCKFNPTILNELFVNFGYILRLRVAKTLLVVIHLWIKACDYQRDIAKRS
jgi:hypothetical protein